ncbi:MAG: hypothetical protein HY332_18490 [Chloroflexi bacterium]|nr:hypothetical protein [Chloroflexota bacterium]
MQLQQSGLSEAQCVRLIALRERIRRGRYRDDGEDGEAYGRRLEFVRWLVRHGRLSDFDVCTGAETSEAAYANAPRNT